MALNVLIPMAGRGQRFKDAGYAVKKPFIEVKPGKTMIELVVENIERAFTDRLNFIFVVLDEDATRENKAILSRAAAGCSIVTIPEVTEGTLKTCMAARNTFALPGWMHEPLLIANADQLVTPSERWNINKTHGALWTFHEPWGKGCYSYSVMSAKYKYVLGVAQKQAISTTANCGWYGFRLASEFFEAGHVALESSKVNGEHYLCGIMNRLISCYGRHAVRSITSEFRSLGTPADLERYQEHLKNPEPLV